MKPQHNNNTRKLLESLNEDETMKRMASKAKAYLIVCIVMSLLVLIVKCISG